MESFKRIVRTLGQVAVAEAVIRLLVSFGIVHWDEGQTAAALGLFTVAVTSLHNVLEDNTPLPSSK